MGAQRTLAWSLVLTVGPWPASVPIWVISRGSAGIWIWRGLWAGGGMWVPYLHSDVGRL